MRITPPHQRSSSAFLKHPPYGFGYLPTFIRYDPIYFMNCSLHSLLVPSDDDITRAATIPLEGEKEYFSSWNETEAGGVSAQFGEVAGIYGFHANGQKQLRTRELEHGIAEGATYEDFHIRYRNFYVAVMENKGAEGSILGAIMEGSATGTNFAMSLFASGFELSDIIVPVIANTGLCMVFGAIIMLNASFPTYVPISKRLDVSDPHESKHCISAFIEVKGPLPQHGGKKSGS
jgi:hypothetical protein